MLVRLAAAPKQSFPEMREPKVGTLVTVKPGGVAQQRRFSNIKIATDIFVAIKFRNSEVTVDESWFVFDATFNCLILHQLGFFGDMALKRTTRSSMAGKNQACRRHKARHGWLTSLFGSLKLRTTNKPQ